MTIAGYSYNLEVEPRQVEPLLDFLAKKSRESVINLNVQPFNLYLKGSTLRIVFHTQENNSNPELPELMLSRSFAIQPLVVDSYLVLRFSWDYPELTAIIKLACFTIGNEGPSIGPQDELEDIDPEDLDQTTSDQKDVKE